DTGVAQTPTKLFLISMLTPEPYLAIVVEYGYNSYRHLYLGNMEKVGNYSGGEIIGGASGPTSTTNTNIFWQDSGRIKQLFGSYQNSWIRASSGGVHVDH